MLTPLPLSFDFRHFRTKMAGWVEDLGAKIESRRKKTKKLLDLRRLRKLGIYEETPSFLLFKSSADVITMMTLKRAVTFLPLTEISSRCMNPNDFKRQQPIHCPCRWDWLSSNLADNPEYWMHRYTQRSPCVSFLSLSCGDRWRVHSGNKLLDPLIR